MSMRPEQKPLPALLTIDCGQLIISAEEIRRNPRAALYDESGLITANPHLFRLVDSLGQSLGRTTMNSNDEYSTGALLAHRIARLAAVNDTATRPLSNKAAVLTEAAFVTALEPRYSVLKRVRHAIEAVKPVMEIERDMDVLLRSAARDVTNPIYLGGAVMTTCLHNGLVHAGNNTEA